MIHYIPYYESNPVLIIRTNKLFTIEINMMEMQYFMGVYWHEIISSCLDIYLNKYVIANNNIPYYKLKSVLKF